MEYEIGWEQATQTVVAVTEDYVVEEVVVDNDVITEEKVVPRDEYLTGRLYQDDDYDSYVDTVKLVVECPYKMEKTITELGNAKVIDVFIGTGKVKVPGNMFFIKNKEVLYFKKGYRGSDGYMSYFLEEGYDFDDFDQLGFNLTGEKYMTIFDNPFK